MSNKNKLDKAIEAIAPAWGEQRAISRHNLEVYNRTSPVTGGSTGGYAGGTQTRKHPNARGGRGLEDNIVGGTYDTLVNNIMDLYRNDPVTRSVVNVATTYTGESRPTATTGDEDFDKSATQYFNEDWWHMADARQRPGVDFGTIQKQWTTWSYIGGDMIYAIMDGSLYPYEGTQIRTPYGMMNDETLFNGIRVEKSTPNRITHYYLCSDQGGKDFSRVRSDQVIYAPNMNWRTAMLRPAPELHAVVDALIAYGRTVSNVQQKMEFDSQLFTIERKGALGNLPGSRLVDHNTSTGTQVEHSDSAWGMRFKINGDVDKDFKLSEMNNPGSTYVPNMEHMARIISAGVGLPMEAVLHLYTNGSYTANRAARTDLMKYLVDRWSWRVKVLCQPSWNMAIARAVESKQIPPAPLGFDGRSLFNKVSWTLPHVPQIDENKEITGDVKKWGAGQDSLSDWGRESGRNRESMLNAHDEDIRDMKDRAESLGVTLAEYAPQLFKATSGDDQGPALPDDDSEAAGVNKWLT